MGLPNLGYKFYIDISKTIQKPYLISVNGLTLSDTKEIIRNIIQDVNITGIEINLSCPNIR